MNNKNWILLIILFDMHKNNVDTWINLLYYNVYT